MWKGQIYAQDAFWEGLAVRECFLEEAACELGLRGGIGAHREKKGKTIQEGGAAYAQARRHRQAWQSTGAFMGCYFLFVLAVGLAGTAGHDGVTGLGVAARSAARHPV